MGLWSFGLIMIGTAIVASALHTLESNADPAIARHLLGYVGVRLPQRGVKSAPSPLPVEASAEIPEKVLSPGGTPR